MTSTQIYQDIQLGNGSKAYKYLKRSSRYVIFKVFKDKLEEDLFQDMYVKFLNQLEKGLKHQGNLEKYFISIICNRWRREYTLKKRISSNELRIEELRIEDIDLSDRVYEEPKLGISVEDLIINLPDIQKQLIRLKYLYNFKDQEIAIELGIRYENVRKYHHKALISLQKNTPYKFKNLLLN